MNTKIMYSYKINENIIILYIVLFANNFKNNTDCAGYFDKYLSVILIVNINYISETLKLQDYYVINRYNKYYIVAFAINYTRFEIFSRLIKN
ncbi:hypothetical protein QJ857_gp0010 [Tupanvirus soda lake]|uniref:Uncharacterized protein n=2 Tax=Tupanvirus TaxID=2094720 RepID=A0A6N1NI09_9VIRU|nr:hypothetical protein QJ857_gp0010 [Tupanvirus soda lake]QKU34659.1 hypothetical protein [Tupanvirus soda lake]